MRRRVLLAKQQVGSHADTEVTSAQINHKGDQFFQLLKRKQMVQWQFAQPIRSLACGDAHADALPTAASEDAHIL